MNSSEFRAALGQFATGVCLVTVNDAASGPIALTANSFSSVSLTPPLVLWSLQNSSECFREFTGNQHFGLSVLGMAHESHSNHYARQDQHEINAQEFVIDQDGVPLFTEAVATFSCRLWAVHEAGDHHVIIGEVMRFASTSQPPLIFHGGCYRQLAPSPLQASA